MGTVHPYTDPSRSLRLYLIYWTSSSCGAVRTVGPVVDQGYHTKTDDRVGGPEDGRRNRTWGVGTTTKTPEEVQKS